MTDLPSIEVRGARTHNLKGVDCRFPHRRITVVTGVSGSGKSSLAFDTVFQEGQRRYLQTLSTYARQFLERVRRPDVEQIRHIQPTLALRQHVGVTQPRSTVATATEVGDYLAVLFSAIGEMSCIDCGQPVRAENPDTIAATLRRHFANQRVIVVAPVALEEPAAASLDALVREGHGRIWLEGQVRRLDELPRNDVLALSELRVVVDRLAPDASPERLRDSVERGLGLGRGRLEVCAEGGEKLSFFEDLRCNACSRAHPPLVAGLFSPNTPLGACPICSGFGRAMGLAIEAVVPDPRRSIRAGAVEPFQEPRGRRHQLALEALCARHAIPIDQPWSRLGRTAQRLVFDGDEVYAGVRGFFRTLENERYTAEAGFILARYRRYTTCEACEGTRLSAEARAVRLRGLHLGGVYELSIDGARAFVENLALTPYERDCAGHLPEEIGHRLRLLQQVGLGYLGLGRATRTLSAGEYQRIQLAACMGRALVDACYVLDEPTAGLHARDSARLLDALRGLRDLGNTVIVVEHDPAIIRGADHIVELGPGGGELGGAVVYEGPLGGLRDASTPTAEVLFAPARPAAPANTASALRYFEVIGAAAHNLKDVSARFPLGRLTVVSGVSGSGKSSLVFEVIHPIVEELLRGQAVDKQRCQDLVGADGFGTVVAMRHAQSGVTARSTVATYIGALDPLRQLLAETAAAREHGLTAVHFSPNVRGGRCDACEGMGVRLVDMQFLSDVEVTCEVCQGKRFKPNVLACRIGGLDIDAIQELSVERALAHFAARPAVLEALQPLAEVGLDYVRLGQPTQTLSGGELQRLRIAEQLVKQRQARDERPALFLFDEPTVGLHGQDVSNLVRLFQRLRSDGHTLIAVEHHLELIAAADWVVDLGPEAGDAGGELVVQGTPAEVAGCERSHTGRCLREAGIPIR